MGWRRRTGEAPSLAVALAAVLAVGVWPGVWPGRADEPVIRLIGRRFDISPSEIRLKQGQPVVLQLESLDRLHGFKVVELGLRADFVPGEITRVRVVPRVAGTFLAICDVFCGEGHDEMGTTIIVTE